MEKPFFSTKKGFSIPFPKKTWLCHRKWWIYSKIFFARLTRKIQVRQVFCKGSIPAVPLRVERQGVQRAAVAVE